MSFIERMQRARLESSLTSLPSKYASILVRPDLSLTVNLLTAGASCLGSKALSKRKT